MESFYREDRTQIIRLEEIVIVRRWINNIIKEYTIETTYLLSLPVYYSC